MKTLAAAITICACLMVSVFADQGQTYSSRSAVNTRFAPLDVYIDSAQNELAVFQFELRTERGDVEIVGIEGGEHAAFAEAPYYDPAALANDRVIIAAFSTGDDLPTGRTRVATLHLMISGEVEPEYALDLSVAGDADAEEVSAQISYEKRRPAK